jgi:hypothetical protein
MNAQAHAFSNAQTFMVVYILCMYGIIKRQFGFLDVKQRLMHAAAAAL